MEKLNASTKYEIVHHTNVRTGQVVETYRVLNPQVETGSLEPGEDIHHFDEIPLIQDPTNKQSPVRAIKLT